MPFAIGGAVAAAIGLTGFAATAVSTLVAGVSMIALSVGLSYAQKALTEEQKPAVGGTEVSMQSGGLVPQGFVFSGARGWATKGSLVYWNASGTANNSPNSGFVQVIQLSDRPEKGLVTTVLDDDDNIVLTGLLVNGEPVTYDPVANTISAPGQPWDGMVSIPEYITDDGSGWLTIKVYTGDQLVADPLCRSMFGADPDYPYTEDMIGAGLTYAVVLSHYNPEVHNGRPDCTFIVESADFYDFRNDDTVGGSGDERFDDPETWTGDASNPIVTAYNLLRGVFVAGALLYGGEVAAAQLPFAEWAAAANECDISTAKADASTEPQFSCGGYVSVDTPVLDLVSSLLKGCNGRIAEMGGIYRPHIGAAGVSVFSVTDADIIVTSPQQFDPFPRAVETFNGIDARYVGREEAFSLKDAPGIRNTDYEDEDGGQRLTAVTYETVESPTQVQRLMNAALEENRRFRRHQFMLGPEAYQLEVNDFLDWTSARNGYSAKLFRVDAITRIGLFLSLLFVSEVDPVDYDWTAATQEQPVFHSIVVEKRSVSQAIVDWSVSGIDNDGVPALLLSWATADSNGDPIMDVRGVEYQVRLASTTAAVGAGEIGITWLNGTLKISESLKPNTAYEVRGRYIPNSDRPTTFSTWLAATTPDINPWAADIAEDLEEINEALDEQVAALDEQVAAAEVRAEQFREQAQRLREIAARESLADVTAFLARNVVRTEMRVAVQSLSAQIIEESEVRIEEGLALATRITLAEASLVDAETGIAANASALSALNSRVTTAEGTITSQATSITALQSTVSGHTSSIAGNASAISALDTRVTSAEGTISSHSTSITSLNSTVSGLSTTVSGHTTSIAGNASAITALDTRVTSAEGTISSHSASITSLTSDLSGLTATVGGHTTSIAANSSAITALDTRVTSAEGTITSHGASITSIQATLTGIQDRGIDPNYAWRSYAGLNAAWSPVSGTFSDEGGYLRFTVTGAGPQFRKTSGVSFSGAINRLVEFKYRITTDAGTWTGRLLYGTSAAGSNHSFSASFSKSFAKPTVGQWVTQRLDMHSLTFGGTDWKDNVIDELRFDFSQGGTPTGQVIDIAYVAIGTDTIGAGSADVIANASAISSLSATVTSQGSTITANSSAITSLQSSVAGVNASGLFSITTAASQSGASVRIALRGRVTTGDSFVEGGLYFEIVSGVPRMMILASKFIVASTVGGTTFTPLSISGSTISLHGDVKVSGTLNLLDATVITSKAALAQFTELQYEEALAGVSDDDTNGVWTDTGVALTVNAEGGLVRVDYAWVHSAGVSVTEMGMRVLRGSTMLAQSLNANGNTDFAASFVYDSPGSSPVTYKIQYQIDQGPSVDNSSYSDLRLGLMVGKR